MDQKRVDSSLSLLPSRELFRLLRGLQEGPLASQLAEEILSKYGEKLIPVVEKDRVVGVITRMDLLHAYRRHIRGYGHAHLRRHHL